MAWRLAYFGAEVPPGTPVLQPFLFACLDLLQAAAPRPDLAPVRDALPELCAMARAAIVADRDDRPLLAHAAGLEGLRGASAFAATAPGRIVWLAAMVASLPDEEAAAATMLVDDLAAVDPALPLRAYAAAIA